MKRISILILCILSFLFLFSCASNKKETHEEDISVVLDSTGLLKKVKTTTMSVVGILKQAENGEYVIYQNMESRSRVSFYINKNKSDKESYDMLNLYLDKDIKVDAVLLKDESIWTKEIYIKNIIEAF